MVEPVARNTAVRRTNPSNRWMLSTNTDMVLVPSLDESLNDLCTDLADAFYGLPRFELPEWLWESLPRMEPGRSIDELRRLGPRLRLDEHTFSDDWIRFDAPGDFQLCLRSDFFAIDGFDEEMLLGWHVDSNLSRRMALHQGSIESLGGLAGYHCNHSRTPTVYQDAAGIENDLVRFFAEVREPELPAERDHWGLVDDDIEEISLRTNSGTRLVNSLIAAIPPFASERVVSRAQDWAFGLTYDSGHVLPFVADSIAVSPAGTTIGYLGPNPTLERMLAIMATELDRGLTFESAHDGPSAAALAGSADLFVVDFGGEPRNASDEHAVDPHPRGLRPILEGLGELVGSERARLERNLHPRRFVLINSTTLYTDAYISADFQYSLSTPHSRVRRATVRRVPSVEDAALAQAERLLRWSERSDDDRRALHLSVGRTFRLADLDDFRAFGAGWATPEPAGIWTSGPQADVRLRVDAGSARHLLSLSIGRVGAGRDESLEVDMLIDGGRVDTHRLPGGPSPFTWRVALPATTYSAAVVDLMFEIHPPHAWEEDERELGLQIHAIELQRDDWRRRLVDVVARLRRPQS